MEDHNLCRSGHTKTGLNQIWLHLVYTCFFDILVLPHNFLHINCLYFNTVIYKSDIQWLIIVMYIYMSRDLLWYPVGLLYLQTKETAIFCLAKNNVLELFV